MNKDSTGLALKGYDAVAYFSEGKPVPGDPAIQHLWMGVIWRFSNAANCDLFAADPIRYSPEYGEFCAYGVSIGRKAPIDPNVSEDCQWKALPELRCGRGRKIADGYSWPDCQGR